MSSENSIDDIEIEPLSSEDLEEVAGGTADCPEVSCSKTACSGGGDTIFRNDFE